MRAIRHVPVVLLAVGTAACTALLGDYGIGSTSHEDGASDGGDAGNAEGGAVAITPADIKIGVLRAQTFTATVPVTWSVQEGAAGGTIDASGRYLAPAKPGVIHVVATAKDDPTQTATATVTVAPLGITIVGGVNGGEGNIDGPAQRAHFRNPSGIAHVFDNAGGNDRYYVADTGNHTIRAFDQQQNKVTTIAGKAGEPGTANGAGAQARFRSPASLVSDRTAKRLYVADAGNDCIRYVDLATGAVNTLAGTCGTPGSDDTGGGLVATFQSIRSITLNGGKFQNQLATSMYVCDGGGSRIRRIDLTAANLGSTKTILNTSGCDVAADFFSNGPNVPDKLIYFNDSGGLKRFRESTLAVETLAATPETFSTGMYVATGYGGQEEVILASANKSQLFRYKMSPAGFDPAALVGVLDDSRVIDGPFASARMGRPNAVDVTNESSGAILVADTSASAIRKVDTQKSQVSTFIGAARVVDRVDGPRNAARFTGPFGITSDDAGNLYVADLIFDGDAMNNTIRKIDPNGTVSSFAGRPSKLGPAGLPENGPAGQATFGFPSDLVFVKGNLYVLDLFGNAVRKVSATGEVTTLAGELGVAGTGDGIGAAAHFTFFKAGGGDSFLGSGITTDGTDLFVADSGNFSIRKITVATGQVTTIAGGTKGSANGVGAAAQFMLPFGLTHDAGFLYVADALDHTIRRLDLKTNEVSGLIGLSGQPGGKDGDAGNALFKNPSRIRADGLGNLFVVELPFNDNNFSGQIRRVDIKARAVGPFAGQPGLIGLAAGPLPSTLNCPLSFTVTPQGDLAFADFCEATVAVIKPL